MDRVVIGVDPHKRSVSIEARDGREVLLATGRFATDSREYQAMLGYARRQWPDRMWAIEGANGIGRPIAQRLLADGERVLDVPAKLAARARIFDTGQGRKTDAFDAHAIVMVALRDKGLRELTVDSRLKMLRLLCDRRDELSQAHAQALNRLHRLFGELIPGGAPVKKSTDQYHDLLHTVRPRDPVRRLCRRMAAEELAELRRLDGQLKAMKAELKAAVEQLGSHLMDIYGVGPAGAARILADVGDVARFPDRAHFASWTGTAPIDASSGEQIRHRLSRAGNRRLNHVLHIATIVQLRRAPTDAQTAGQRLAAVEDRMVAVLDELGLTALVTSIAGLSPVGAAAILAGDPRRFASARAMVKHAGLAPRQKLSGTFIGRTKLTGAGRPGLRLAAWRAVWGALKANPVYATRYRQLTSRENNKLTVPQAQAVIAATILRHLHAVITTGQAWSPTIATHGTEHAEQVTIAA
jgi:transposase